MKPKILFLLDCPYIPNSGGLERVTSVLKEGLIKIGYEVSVVSALPTNLLEKFKDKKPEFDIFHADYEESDKRKEFHDFLKNKDIDIIIFQDVNLPLRWYMKNTPRGIKRVSVLHMQPYSLYKKERYARSLQPWESLFLRGKLFKLLAISMPVVFRKIYINKLTNKYSEALANLEKFILLSHSYEPRAKRFLPAKFHNKITSIVNPNTFAIDYKPDLNKKENMVLWIGRMYNAQKNATGFIDIWREFSSKHPDWKAVMLGDGIDMKTIKQYAESRGVENLKIMGNVNNIDDYYKKASILCMTSTYEGWPMTLNEAMSFGCVPVIFDSYEAAGDIVNNNVNGILVKPFDKGRMVDALSQLISDEERRKTYAQNAIIKSESFSIDKIITHWDNLFKSLNEL